jgi:hypothetical protein
MGGGENVRSNLPGGGGKCKKSQQFCFSVANLRTPLTERFFRLRHRVSAKYKAKNITFDVGHKLNISLCLKQLCFFTQDFAVRFQSRIIWPDDSICLQELQAQLFKQNHYRNFLSPYQFSATLTLTVCKTVFQVTKSSVWQAQKRCV